MKKKKELFTRDVTPVLKGIAIILMFSLHLLKTDWMVWPEWILDFSVNGESISTIFANTGDICIGIFAFITGYSWWEGFRNKSMFQRLGSLYLSYWIALISFCLPMRYIIEYGSGFVLYTSVTQLIQSLLAIASPSASYCWYVSFFTVAVLTYRPCIAIVKRLHLNGFVEIFLLCVAGMVLRVLSRLVYNIAPFSYLLFNFLSHYFQWMPVILSGAVAKRDRLLEHMHGFFCKNFGKKYAIWFGILLVVIVFLIKITAQVGLNVYSNFDSFLILPFMYGLVVISRRIIARKKYISAWLSKFGKASLYMWLTHNVLQYEAIQNLLYRLRNPLLIVLAGLLVMMPIGNALNKIEINLRKQFAVLHSRIIKEKEE